MAMQRRQFIRYSLASTGFIVALDALYPTKADAFLFLLLRGTLMDMAIGALLQSAFTLARNAATRRSQEWYERRLNVQLAQREFLSRQFTNVAVAEVGETQYEYFLAAQKRERLGYNVAFGFPDISRSGLSAFSGPASVGMAIAAKYLKEDEKMSSQEVQAAILPRYKQYDDWLNWASSPSFVAYANVASDNGVVMRYDSVDPRPGGYGIIDITVNANRRIKIPQIKVQYA
jgi:hypothetical protein